MPRLTCDSMTGSSPVNQVSRTLLLEIFLMWSSDRALRTKAMVWGSMKYWVLIASAMAVASGRRRSFLLRHHHYACLSVTSTEKAVAVPFRTSKASRSTIASIS